ncbi:hypothetical protein PoB_005113500 [Plakobranchus ocellatus]|uniref:DUF7959 domain-containing protein n=1 Tax=Plakobranchus ocellatus TaxID=259542 RepID=A0AAV4BZS8_9GAST|nr:hypothetical protein PoB_005113500 [Plakobranchus ocellatus]
MSALCKLNNYYELSAYDFERFLQGIESSVNDYATITKNKNLRIPYKRLLYPDDSSKVYTTYYYQVDFTEPSLFVDLSGCFNEQKLVSLYVPGLTIDRVQKDETIVLRRALRTLTDALDVRFTRIAGLAIVFQGDKGYFVFQLLEAPKHAPNVKRIGSEVSLEQAYELLKNGIESEKIMFDVGNKEITVISGAKMEDIKIGEPERGSDGYSGAALGGLAFGMAVLGLAGGGAGGYWFLMKQ